MALPTTPSRLSGALRGKLGPATASPFALAVSGARVAHPFTIPRLGVAAAMTLARECRVVAIEAELHAFMTSLGLPLNATTELHWELERARRFLTEVVIEPEAAVRGEIVPFGTLAEWGDVDADVIGDVWRTYADVRAAFDPVSSAELTQDDLDMIAEAVKKKDLQTLRLYGVRLLSSYLVTTASPPSTSPAPTSIDSASYGETSLPTPTA